MKKLYKLTVSEHKGLKFSEFVGLLHAQIRAILAKAANDPIFAEKEEREALLNVFKDALTTLKQEHDYTVAQNPPGNMDVLARMQGEASYGRGGLEIIQIAAGVCSQEEVAELFQYFLSVSVAAPSVEPAEPKPPFVTAELLKTLDDPKKSN